MSGFSHYVRFFAALFFSALLIYGDLHLQLFADLRGQMSLVLSPFRVAAEFPKKAYNAVYGHVRAREGLLEEKRGLEATIQENAVRLQSFDFFARQNDELRAKLNLKKRLAVGGDVWAAAGLERNFSQPQAARLFLDKGATDGILPGMTVVDENGVMGQVIRVDANTGVANLITGADQWLAARVERNNLLLILRGDGEGGLRVEYLPNSADVAEGDSLVAASDAYPPGYPVGVVEAVNNETPYKSAQVRPYSSFWDNNIALVYKGRPQAAGQ